MSLNTYQSHARLLQRMLTQMDETFEAALRHPNLSRADQEVAGEMRQWAANGLFLCEKIEALQGRDLNPDYDPLVAAMYTLDDQVMEVSEKMRQKDLFRPGAAERVQEMLDAMPTPE